MDSDAPQEGYYQSLERQKHELCDRLGSHPGLEESQRIADELKEIDEKIHNPPWKELTHALFWGRLKDVILHSEDGKIIPELNRLRVPLLLQPAAAGDEKIVDYFLSKGADPNVPGNDNLTALAMAAMKDHVGIFKKLLQAGADPAVTTTAGDTIQDLAEYNGSEGVLKILKNKKLMAKLSPKKDQGPDPLSIPLRQSELWRSTVEICAEYPLTNPTPIHRFHHMLFVLGNGYQWVGGKLDDSFDRKLKNDLRYAVPPLEDNPSVPPQLPATPFLEIIPVIPQKDFLKYINDGWLGDEPLHAAIYPQCRMTTINQMPYNIDIHYLTAAMMMLKHVWQNQEVLRTDCAYSLYSFDSQLVVVRDALHTGFTIIERRSLQEPFKRACQEMAEALPELTAYSAKYVEIQEKSREVNAAFKELIDNPTPEQRARLASYYSRIMPKRLQS